MQSQVANTRWALAFARCEALPSVVPGAHSLVVAALASMHACRHAARHAFIDQANFFQPPCSTFPLSNLATPLPPPLASSHYR
jgi:hypothetical protein